jgi:hypothetical protein
VSWLRYSGRSPTTRIAYRGTGVVDLHVADAVLNMPAGMHSHGIAKLAAIEAARGSFAEATGRVPPTHTPPRPPLALDLPDHQGLHDK